MDFDAEGKPTTVRVLKQDAYLRAGREGCDVERTPEWQRAVEIEMQSAVDDEVIRQILATPDADVRWICANPLSRNGADMNEETTIRFPDGIKLDADVSAGELANVTERTCVNCGGQEQMRGGFVASKYTVVRCPSCGLLHPGEPVQ